MNDEREQEPTPDAEAEAKERADQGRRTREEMDETPPPGADPLHEGP